MSTIKDKKEQIVTGLNKEEIKDRIEDVDEKEARLAREAFLCLIGTFTSQVIVGSSISISDMQYDIVSYFESFLPADEDSSIATAAAWIGPMFIVVSAGFFPLGIYAAKSKYIGPQVIIGLAGVVLISNMLLSSWNQSMPGLFVTTFIAGLGISQGLIYAANLVAAWSHYPDRKGLATGINSSALVLGQFIYNVWTAPSSGECSSSDTDCESDIYDTNEVWDTNLRAFINTSCWIWVVQLIITIMLVKLKEEDKDLDQEEAELRGLLHMNDEQKEKRAKKKIPKTALLWHRDFWKLCGISIGQYYAYLYISDYYSDMAKVYFDSSDLTLYGNIATVCQAIWLFAVAQFIDFIDVQLFYKRLMYFQVVCCCLFFVSMWGGKTVFCIVLCLTYMTGGTIWVVLPLLALQIFGIDHGGSLYGYVYPFLFIVSFTLDTFTSMFLGNAGWGGMMVICVSFTLFGIYLLHTFPDKHFFKFHDAYEEYERQRQIQDGKKYIREQGGQEEAVDRMEQEFNQQEANN